MSARVNWFLRNCHFPKCVTRKIANPWQDLTRKIMSVANLESWIWSLAGAQVPAWLSKHTMQLNCETFWFYWLCQMVSRWLGLHLHMLQHITMFFQHVGLITLQLVTVFQKALVLQVQYVCKCFFFGSSVLQASCMGSTYIKQTCLKSLNNSERGSCITLQPSHQTPFKCSPVFPKKYLFYSLPHAIIAMVSHCEGLGFQTCFKRPFVQKSAASIPGSDCVQG